jgi:hypothetical protein
VRDTLGVPPGAWVLPRTACPAVARLFTPGDHGSSALVLDGGLEAGEADRVRPKDRHSER